MERNLSLTGLSNIDMTVMYSTVSDRLVSICLWWRNWNRGEL